MYGKHLKQQQVLTEQELNKYNIFKRINKGFSLETFNQSTETDIPQLSLSLIHHNNLF